MIKSTLFKLYLINFFLIITSGNGSLTGHIITVLIWDDYCGAFRQVTRWFDGQK